MLKTSLGFISYGFIFLLAGLQLIQAQTHHKAHGFFNPFPNFEKRGYKDIFRWLVLDKITGKRPQHPDHYRFTKTENNGKWLRENHAQFSVTWVGHSTLLIQIDGLNILTDPIWSERASPLSFAGPKRAVPPGISFTDLPKIDLALISHDHYDHLDKATVKKLGNAPFYLVPLGVGSILRRWGISHFQELDWWAEIVFNKLRLICAPAQHFSGRTPFDRNRTLWAGWTIIGQKRSVYFGGDSGYFPGFAEIGRRFGPFDLCALPIGAYKPRWFMRGVHLSPADALQAFKDLQGKVFWPIHWGTFDLADEPLDDPPQQLEKLISRKHLSKEEFWILKPGQTHRFDISSFTDNLD